jgi:drug/metabolite transporter (DMT)-like permease
VTRMIGETAALLTAACWAFNSLVFTQAGKRVGAVTVNNMRLWLALPALLLLNWLLRGTPLPLAIEPARFLNLGISGVIGFVIGDTLLFESFLMIGPRLAMLLSLLVPVFGAILAWAFLGEALTGGEAGCILLTIGGVAWVVTEAAAPAEENVPLGERRFRLGVWLAIGGAAGQAVGLLFSRWGLAGGYPAITATLVRVGVAAIVLALLAIGRGRLGDQVTRMRDRAALLQIGAGALTGPVLGVTLSLVAIAHAHIGVASTLMSLTPVLLLPASRFIFKEKISARAILGTLVALLGVVLLFLT